MMMTSSIDLWRECRYLQRRLQRFIRREYSKRWFPLCSLLLFTKIVAAVFFFYRYTGWRSGQRTRILPASCTNANIYELKHFDTKALLERREGKGQNEFETRHQETLWDTLEGTAFYPAWSDMKWNIPQYGRGFANDLARIQSIASRTTKETRPSLGRYTLQHAENDLLYGDSDSDVQIDYLHHRLDRLRGLQFAVSFRRKEHMKNGTLNNQAHKMLVAESIEGKCSISTTVSPTNEIVYILLPYRGRPERLRLFVQNYFALRHLKGENIYLIISVLRRSTEDIATVNAVKAEFFGESASESGILLHENSGDLDGNFSRGVALREAAKLTPEDSSILFHCDVDMIVLPNFLSRCRQNTILGSQVYYPVFYSLYPYANSRPAIIQRNGFWRTTSFGMVCIRRRDFTDVGPYDDAETRFRGWGSEDVHMFEKIRNTSNLVAFRAVEPGLMHRWHSKACDRRSPTYMDCMKTNFMTVGHPIRVGPILLDAYPRVEELYERVAQA